MFQNSVEDSARGNCQDHRCDGGGLQQHAAGGLSTHELLNGLHHPLKERLSLRFRRFRHSLCRHTMFNGAYLIVSSIAPN